MSFNQSVFNVFFIPETVNYQSLALVSLLLNTQFKFRLVGNALSQTESKLLEEIANCSERLSFVNFESEYIIPHGTLIDLLFLHESSPLFCFVDSDVFIFDKLTKSAEDMIGNNAGFSSGSRIENETKAQYAGFRGGATTISPCGTIPLPTSFFCVYQRKAIQLIIDKFGVGFEQYRYEHEIPKEANAMVKKLDLKYEMFDTGKLLGVLFHQENQQLKHEDIPGFYHIGGMSGRYLQGIKLAQKQIFDDKYLVELKQVDRINNVNYRNDYEIKLKRFYGSFFYVYLNSIIGKSPEPKIIINIPEVKVMIKSLTSMIIEMLKEAKINKETNKIINIILHKKI